MVYTEENGVYTLDCSASVWSTDQIHNNYQDPAHQYGVIGFLSDVDFVIENETHIILVEYKNASIPGAANPGAFSPTSGNKLDKVAKKFFDSLPWLYLAGKDKPKKYVYILEYPAGNSTSRRLIRNQLKERLPFALQSRITNARRTLIDEIRVVDIAEWNADAALGKFPMKPVPPTADTLDA